MIKEVNGKKYILVEHDNTKSYACNKCVAQKSTYLCASINDDCDGGYFSEVDDQTPEVTNNQEQPTLRDQFAMVALNGLISANQHVIAQQLAAKTAYAFADAMMEARSK